MTAPPAITDPVVMYDAIRTYHEYGPYSWTTDGYGAMVDGRPPSAFERALWWGPIVVLVGALICMWIALMVADLWRLLQ
jgi:hypothetical protein